MAQRLDIDSLLREGLKVYVKNTSRPMANIILTFVTGQGKSVARNIPRTFIPLCLTDTVSPADIQNSTELRRFINAGILTLVHPDDAAKVLNTEAGQDEANRLNLSEFSARASATQRVLELESQRRYQPSVNTSLEQEVQSDPVNNRVKSTLLQVESKDLGEREAVAQLRIMTDELTQHDVTYILSHVKDTDGPIKRFAHQMLAEMSARVDSDVIYNQDDEQGPPEDPAQLAAARAQQKL